MTHFWMACLMTNLQPHEREREKQAALSPRKLLFFLFFCFGCFDHYSSSFMSFGGLQLTGRAVQQSLSPSKMFPLISALCLRDWVALTRPLSRTDSVPTSPACSEFGPKTDRNSPSWSNWPCQSDQTTAKKQQTLSFGPCKDPSCIYMLTRNSTNY